MAGQRTQSPCSKRTWRRIPGAKKSGACWRWPCRGPDAKVMHWRPFGGHAVSLSKNPGWTPALDSGTPGRGEPNSAQRFAVASIRNPDLAMTATAYSRSGTKVQLEVSNAVLGSLAIAGKFQTARII